METFHEKLKAKMDQYAHLICKLTKSFPKDELYGIVSQLRKSALSRTFPRIPCGLAAGMTGLKLILSTGSIPRGKVRDLSVILNYIEGYARARDKVHINFLEISYGSLQESKYLLNFAFKEDYFSKEIYYESAKLADDIGGMLWGMLKKLK